MYKISSFTGRFFFLVLAVALSVLPGHSQQAVNWAAPLSQCWSYQTNEATLNPIASDNAGSLFLSLSNGSIESIGSNGKKMWSIELAGEINSNILIKNEILLVSTRILENKSSKIHLIKKSNGTIQRIFYVKSVDELTITDDIHRRFVVTSKDTVLKFDIRNGQLWNEHYLTEITTNLSIDKNKIVFGSSNKTFISIDSDNGAILSQLNLKGIASEIFYGHGNELFVGDEVGNVYSIDKVTNKIKWRSKVGGKIVEISEWKNKLLISSNDNYVYLLDKFSGDKIWKSRLAGRVIGKEFLGNDNAIFLSHGTDTALILNLENGRILNKLVITNGDYFVSKPLLVESQIIVPTNTGFSAFAEKCKKKA